MADLVMASTPRAMEKRLAIVTAARELFVREGVDRVSMDAVAAQAGVSKATVYGYFGDKQRLFRAIVVDASDSLTTIAKSVVEEHLSLDADLNTVADLEQALSHAGEALGRTVVGSSEYAAVFALVAQRRWHDPESTDDVATQVIEDAFTERFSVFAERGLLFTDDPRRATDHFFALTVLLAYNEQADLHRVDMDRVQRTMSDGVAAFMRAYGRPSAPSDVRS